MNDDLLIACADLAGRAGAASFEIGHTGDDDTPVDQVRWYAVATYRDARLIADDHPSPTVAALALAERLLDGARCRCTAMVTLSDDRPGCRWRLVGARWEPGCDAMPIRVTGGQRGDVAAMERAMAQVPPGGNRAARRAAKRRRP
ncbi:hypothetical protein [Micromonospora carbonacea]|uniref:Uncharacterized protein n=1 Tax=Micromonospora carbonacea TaxID=47853 RepID=A0A1C4WXI5_9ACTN|nr:hypothetical protein [Micromonospora carbonacea]SCF00844.1 hypothetical protein GA0070563_10495 [Micromonospora carbonacea]